MKKITLLFLALLPLSAFAQQVDPCIGKGSAQEMSACAKEEYKKASTKLDSTYQALQAQMPAKDVAGIPYPAVKKQLKLAQQAWSGFVEQDCKTINIYNTGSVLQDIEYFSCMRLHAVHRTADLEQFLSHREKAK
ncbi:lysozyme inhibitor LprI family protein [Herminiimonas sp. NPDC097707]|uniref:lysozyme inhibitor LprI family protein n=1 Tax=Herminiimonas sp. NPDC097707 TaxID=3364007 RepID=UPI00383B7CDC